MLGFCTNVRVRITRELSVTIDPALEWVWHERTGDATLAMSPGVTYSLSTGEGRMANSHAFASAGLDAWLPLAGFRANPDLFGGAHVGLGATTIRGRAGFTAEVRGLVRGGIGARGAAEPEDRSSLRVGFEARMSVVVGF